MATPKDDFSYTQAGLGTVGTRQFNVTAGVDLAYYPTGLYVGTQGDLSIEDENGTQSVYKNYIGWFPFRPTKVLVATTATDIVAIY